MNHESTLMKKDLKPISMLRMKSWHTKESRTPSSLTPGISIHQKCRCSARQHRRAYRAIQIDHFCEGHQAALMM